MPAEVTDRKSMLRQAWDAASADEEETVVADDPAPEPAAEPEPAPEPEAAAAPEGETADERAARERDEHGRFKAAGDAPAKPAPARAAATQPVKPAAPVAQPEKPAAAAPTTPAAPTARPPQSWSAAEREAWAKLPAEAQRAVLRTEQETQRVMQRNAQLTREHGEAQKFKGEVEGFVRPFEGIFRAQGMEPMQGVANVVQAYAALHYGNQQQKDSILAGLVGQFGSVDGINALLSGQAQPQRAAPPPPARAPQGPPDVRAVLREELQNMQQQAALSRAEQQFKEFRATNPEFLEVPGVWENMQTILDAASQRGRNLDYMQAYDVSLKMDPEIQAVMQRRAEAAALTQPSAGAPTARARVAAATVRSRPAAVGDTGVDLTDRRAVLQRAAERSRT